MKYCKKRIALLGPTAAPRNVTALSRTSQSFLVSWLEPTLNGELVRYEVSVRKKADILATISPTTQTVAKSTPSSAPATEAPSESPDEELINAGSKLSIIIGSREKWTEYMVQVRAVTKPEQPGRYSDAVTVRTVEDGKSCDKVLQLSYQPLSELERFDISHNLPKVIFSLLTMKYSSESNTVIEYFAHNI